MPSGSAYGTVPGFQKRKWLVGIEGFRLDFDFHLRQTRPRARSLCRRADARLQDIRMMDHVLIAGTDLHGFSQRV